MMVTRRLLRTASVATWAAGALLFTGCGTLPFSDDPMPGADATVRLATDAVGELGVATPYGIVFLGRGARSGDVGFAAWFADGPSYENGIIEPVGGGLFVTEAEIVLATVPLSFVTPRSGSEVIVRGRNSKGPYEFEAKVYTDDRIDGLLLRSNADLRKMTADQVGAGVYVKHEDELRLVGLLAGKLTLTFDDGPSEVFSVVGPIELWRLVTYRRDLDRPRRPAHRGDVVP